MAAQAVGVEALGRELVGGEPDADRELGPRAVADGREHLAANRSGSA